MPVGRTASALEYDRIIAEFVANDRQAFCLRDEILVETLILRYFDYADDFRDME